MKRECLQLMVLAILVIYGDAQICPSERDQVEIGRTCQPVCATSSDCSSGKTCVCDGKCGLSCVNEQLSCGAVPLGTNALLKYAAATQNTYGSTAVYECNTSYYKVSGATSRRCRSDGIWDGTPLVCQVGCGIPTAGNPLPLNSYAENVGLATGFKTGKELTIVCNYGYDLSTSNVRATCQNDLTWSYPDFTCERQDCGEPTSPVNGGTKLADGSVDYRFGSTVNYFCNPGYEKTSGSSSTNCVASGWSNLNRPPTCTVISCPAPPSITNGRIKTGVQARYEYRDQVVYECDSPLVVVGNARVTCEFDKTWKTVPTCAVDTSCTFDNLKNVFCGYTVTGWVRSDPLRDTKGLWTFAAKGTGSSSTNKLQSVAVSLLQTAYCLNFVYQADSPNAPGDILSVKVAESGQSSAGVELFDKVDETAGGWINGTVSLTPTTTGIPAESSNAWNKNIVWTFKVVDSAATVNVDNIKLEPGACPKAATTTTTTTTVTTVPSTTASTVPESSTTSKIAPTTTEKSTTERFSLTKVLTATTTATPTAKTTTRTTIPQKATTKKYTKAPITTTTTTTTTTTVSTTTQSKKVDKDIDGRLKPDNKPLPTTTVRLTETTSAADRECAHIIYFMIIFFIPFVNLVLQC